MPTYDYRCNACDHEFELFQSMSAGVKKKCPECGKMALERLIGTGAAVMFKGSGFYETDYRSDSYKKSAEADKKASETKPETKSESKSENKTDSKAGKKSESKTAPKTKAESKK
ncbi:MAG: zinc ribbon domain-containing protein [Phycisphaerales bacterium]